MIYCTLTYPGYPHNIQYTNHTSRILINMFSNVLQLPLPSQAFLLACLVGAIQALSLPSFPIQEGNDDSGRQAFTQITTAIQESYTSHTTQPLPDIWTDVSVVTNATTEKSTESSVATPASIQHVRDNETDRAPLTTESIVTNVTTMADISNASRPDDFTNASTPSFKSDLSDDKSKSNIHYPVKTPRSRKYPNLTGKDIAIMATVCTFIGLMVSFLICMCCLRRVKAPRRTKKKLMFKKKIRVISRYDRYH